MNVIVASRNPAKIRAVKLAFDAVLPDAEAIFEGIAVDSGVPDQPVTDEQTRTGAWNRARGARQDRPEADYWVGLEGGLERFDNEWQGSAWMVVMAANGRSGQARTVSLPLPPAVQALLDEGLELGDANDRVFDTRNSKQAGGAFGLLTGGRLTRGGVYAQALGLALLPVVHPLWAPSD